MSTGRQITRALILVTVLLWIFWDVWVFYTSGNPSTESATLVRWSWYHPWIPFMAGLLCGHIFFDLREPVDWPKDET